MKGDNDKAYEVCECSQLFLARIQNRYNVLYAMSEKKGMPPAIKTILHPPFFFARCQRI